MKVQKFDGSRERHVLTLMAVNDGVLGRITDRWEENGRFADRIGNRIGGWCVDSFRKYNKAPGSGGLRGYFDEWVGSNPEEAERDATERMLAGIVQAAETAGPELTNVNVSREVDRAANLFHLVEAERLIEAVRADVERGAGSKAVSRIESFRKVELGLSAGADPLSDPAMFRKALDRKRFEPLVRYPGALGSFFSDSFSRDCLVGFMAAEGSGKSWWLLDLAVRLVSDRYRVAFFDCGDMTEEQVDERIAVRLAHHPTRSDDNRWPLTVRRPKKLHVTSDGAVDVSSTSMKFEAPLESAEAEEALFRWRRQVLKSNRSFFMRCCFPNSTASVTTLRTTLRCWEADGFVPDAVIVDYADILAPLNPRADKLERENDTWRALRRMSQELRVLVVSASQINREGYKARVLRKEHTGGSKAKQADVSDMFALASTDEEQAVGVVRINRTKRRNSGATNPARCVYVAGCLPLGEPAVVSAFKESKKGGSDD